MQTHGKKIFGFLDWKKIMTSEEKQVVKRNEIDYTIKFLFMLK